MIKFTDFMHQFENLWGNIIGNPAMGGKKPSDGIGGYSDSSNQGNKGPNTMQAGPNTPVTQPGPMKMMRKRMKKA